MFKQVITAEDHMIFDDIYNRIWDEQHFIKEERGTSAVRYLFYYEDVPVGTLELLPFQPDVFTTVNNDFSFSSLDSIRENISNTWEMDKLGFLPENRGKSVESVIPCLIHHYHKYGTEYAICLMDYKFFRLMRIRYRHFPMKQVGEPFIVEGEKSLSVPIVMHFPSMYERYIKEQERLTPPVKVESTR